MQFRLKLTLSVMPELWKTCRGSGRFAKKDSNEAHVFEDLLA